MKRFCTFLVILIALSCGLNIAFAQEVSIRRLENTPEVSHVGQVLKYRIDIDDAGSLTKADLTWSAPGKLIDIKTIGTTNPFTSDWSNRTFNAAALAPGRVSYVAGWLTFRAISAGSGNLRVTGTLTTIQGTVNVDTQLPIIVRSPDPSHPLPAGGDFEFVREVSADSPGWNSVGVLSMTELHLYNVVNIAEYEVELTYDVNLLGVMTVNTSPGTTVVGASAGRITLRGSWTTPQSSNLFLATLLYTPIRGGGTTVKVTRGILKNSATDTPGTVADGGFYMRIVDKVITNVQVTPGDGKLAVTWDPVPGADSYTVRGYGRPDLGRVEARVQAPTTNVTLTNLSKDGEYTVWVSADKDDRLFATARKGVKATPTLNQAPQTGDRPVHIPDPNLRAAIEEALGKTSGATISPADMRTLTELDAREQDIQDITGLEFATNLTGLYLGSNKISDVSPLDGLTELIKLFLNKNRISDVSSLAGLTNLIELTLSYNEISDVSPLAGLTRLTGLSLSYNEISDVSPLAGLTRLTSLGIFSNEISDVSPLAGLTKLKWLDLSRNEISDFSPIAGLIPNLEYYNNNNQDVSQEEQPVVEDGGDDGPSDGIAIVSINPPQVAPAVGSQLTIPLKITNAQNVIAYQAAVNFDPSELRYVSSAYADYPSAGTFFLPPRISEGRIVFVATGTEVGAASGTLGTVTFAVVASKTPTIWLTDVELAGSDEELLAVIIKDGSPQGERRVLPPINESSPKNQATAEKDPEDVQAAVDTDAPVVGPNTAINIPDPDLRANIELRLGKRRGETIRASDMLALTTLQFHALEKKNGLQDLTGLEFATNLTELAILSGTVSDVSPLAHLRKLRVLKIVDHEVSDVSPLAGLKNLTYLSLTSNEIVDISPLAGLINLETLFLSSNRISDFSPIAGLIPNLTDYENSNQRAADPNAPVNIPDPNLRTAIEKKLGKSPGATITGTEMRTLTRLDASKIGIQDITGIEFATNLTALYLNENEISDVSALIQFKELRTLWLYVNQISDIAALAQLTNLTSLSLSHNQLSDVSALADLKRLKTLWIDGNQISDIAALAQLTDMRELSLPDNRVLDVSPLVELKNLTRLHLVNNHISDVSALAGLTNLRELYLSKNKILDFSPIAGLIPNLKVYENSDQIVNIPDPKLRLAIEKALGKASGSNITSTDMLKLTELQPKALGILKSGERLELKDLTGLEFATNLKKLVLSNSDISDLSPLAGLKQLETLGLALCRISDISALSGLESLTSLFMRVNFISDLSPLAKLKNLQIMRLSVNGISDISPLAGLTNLRRLWLKDNLISDVSPLAGLTRLTELDLWGNRISDFSPIDRIVRNIDPKWYIFFGGGQKLPGGGCRTQMSADLESLKSVRVTPRIQQKTMSSEAGASYGTVKAAVSSQGGQNRLWVPEDTVASSEEEKYSLVLTVEFLDGWKFERERRMVEEAATAWALSGNILFKFVSSGKSDIRVRFDDEKTGFWQSDIGAPKGWDPEEHWNSNEHTMTLTTDVSYGTALHEFGHALGLTHEHLAPEFLKHFAWKFEGEKLYYQISDDFIGYETPPTKENKESIDHNFLKLRELDEEKSFFDIQSVMTYELDDSLIEVRPDADQKIKDIFARNARIPDNSSLSSGDRKFIAECYGDPIARAKISGKVRVDGEDIDTISNDTIDGTKPIHPHIVGHHHLFHGREDRAMEFKWGGECRVEVYLTTRKIEKRQVEVGVAALLYEGSWLDGGENTDDLEDIRCRSFKVPVGGTELIKISLKNVSWGPRDLDSREISCKKLDIDFKDGGLRGDLIGGGGDWADVYVTVSASYVSTTFAAAAPSMIVASATSVSETADRFLSSDVNGDGQVNVDDLVMVSNYLGQTGSIDPRVDVNGDGIVTIADLVLVAQHLGSSTYASAPIGVVPLGLKYSTVVGWIDQARVENDGSFAFQQGIAKLEYLLTLIIPEKTALLTNYPNPFNPETWIPYHLAKPADVTLTIYAVDGNVVRTLALGHQVAGYYQSKARAAYWDGRNAVGERVASGIYFYTLTAGDFAATKKLLIRK